eukprot:TRINITY_DN4120_c0_g5_i1.p1 TRINITY_DN4120_c0_g5~~TRINITY_DN4120_c0_g5_i1.p1  ORF type:complete len:491 (+),score=60.28 TRINITY_DN4120_c0_g5_i1:166-1638(+)
MAARDYDNIDNDSEESTESDADSMLDEGPVKEAPRRLLFLLCLCAAIEGSDMVLLGSTAYALQRDIGLTMNNLAFMTLLQALSMAALAPFWGVLADRRVMQRKTIIILGAVAQGFLTIALSTVEHLPLMAFLRALNGGMLASLRPVANGIVADVASESQRGKAFGWIGLSMNLGSCLGSLIATPMSTSTILGMQGWRVAYIGLGGASILVGMLTLALMSEPPREGNIDMAGRKGKRRAMLEEIQRFCSYFSKMTFCVLVIQGMFGCVPWNALSYQTVFFQLSGLTSFQAAVLPALQQSSAAVGSLLGGFIGDRMGRKCPLHGRAFTAQVSVAAGIPVAALIFNVVPSKDVAFLYYVVLSICLGLFATWTPAAANLPMLSQIVDSDGRAAIMAWQSALEGSWGAIFGNVAVGVLAQNVFGYDISSIQEGSGLDPANMRALGYALTFTSIVPWLICLTAYSALHWSYPRDLKAIHKEKKAAHDELNDSDALE